MVRFLLCRPLINALFSSNINKAVKQNFDQKKISSGYSKKNGSVSYVNDRTSVRIQQWLHSIKNSRAIKKQAKYRQNREPNISNNAINITESKLNLSQSIQEQLIKHLNGWHCLQLLYHRPCDYTLGMNLSQVTRSIMSNSQEMLILSTFIQPFLKQQSTNQVMKLDTNMIKISFSRWNVSFKNDVFTTFYKYCLQSNLFHRE